MTKADLIKFLEPFTDEAIILVEDMEEGLVEPNPEYRICETDNLRLNYGVAKKDGFIVL